MTNANYQAELEISFLLYGDYDSLSVYAQEQNNKLFEEDITIPGKRHNGKHDTHARKRKKGIYAELRKADTHTVREARKRPYSCILGKGKKYDRTYQDELPMFLRRQEQKAKAELFLYLND